MRDRSLGQEDPLEEGTATHASILAWRTPWAEEHSRLQSIGSHRVGHNCSNLAHSTHTPPRHFLASQPEKSSQVTASVKTYSEFST